MTKIKVTNTLFDQLFEKDFRLACSRNVFTGPLKLKSAEYTAKHLCVSHATIETVRQG